MQSSNVNLLIVERSCGTVCYAENREKSQKSPSILMGDVCQRIGNVSGGRFEQF
jgi:hypothetical protein